MMHGNTEITEGVIMSCTAKFSKEIACTSEGAKETIRSAIGRAIERTKDTLDIEKLFSGTIDRNILNFEGIKKRKERSFMVYTLNYIGAYDETEKERFYSSLKGYNNIFYLFKRKLAEAGLYSGRINVMTHHFLMAAETADGIELFSSEKAPELPKRYDAAINQVHDLTELLKGIRNPESCLEEEEVEALKKVEGENRLFGFIQTEKTTSAKRRFLEGVLAKREKAADDILQQRLAARDFCVEIYSGTLFVEIAADADKKTIIKVMDLLLSSLIQEKGCDPL